MCLNPNSSRELNAQSCSISKISQVQYWLVSSKKNATWNQYIDRWSSIFILNLHKVRGWAISSSKQFQGLWRATVNQNKVTSNMIGSCAHSLTCLRWFDSLNCGRLLKNLSLKKRMEIKLVYAVCLAEDKYYLRTNSLQECSKAHRLWWKITYVLLELQRKTRVKSP